MGKPRQHHCTRSRVLHRFYFILSLFRLVHNTNASRSCYHQPRPAFIHFYTHFIFFSSVQTESACQRSGFEELFLALFIFGRRGWEYPPPRPFTTCVPRVGCTHHIHYFLCNTTTTHKLDGGAVARKSEREQTALLLSAAAVILWGRKRGTGGALVTIWEWAFLRGVFRFCVFVVGGRRRRRLGCI